MRVPHALWASGESSRQDHIEIEPPLLNSSNPWATDFTDLEALYSCPYTGAVTTRTALIDGFAHDDSIHQYTFFDPQSHSSTPAFGKANPTQTGSLNTLGYSPLLLSEYLEIVAKLSDVLKGLSPKPKNIKPIIISVTGSPLEIRRCHDAIATTQEEVDIPLLMEINLSCPNIADKPPPAYSGERLIEYLEVLEYPMIPIGLKVPPYTYSDQFKALVDALSTCASNCKVSFITATNTLGSSLILSPIDADEDAFTPTINSSTGAGIGGMAGAPLHPLALGNVRVLSEFIKARPELQHIQIIGVGGVSDAEGYKRMRSVGASAVAVGTALGRIGLAIFQEIDDGLVE
ncbi:FMN-linked oxidoreductase [Rhizodiscina lignyota]|uniref:Dihydroorotate dehydrogenase (fumarate) n=1 Tax=Rhizodiscina lignyota TaxID=1504668 RepID=A0A9P4IA30_9PEZI|nr:FMN-linked oxidoreductase [Rhizodiscina lignyota]